MNGFPSQKEVAALRVKCKPGTRVCLVSMDDPYSLLKPGSLGTVEAVDDIGTIHVNWDCGSYLGLVYGEDKYEIVAANS